MARVVGMTIDGRYIVGERVREGRFGDVHAGTDESGGAVSIKLLDPTLSIDSAASARFDREARLLASFRHPGTPRLLAHGRTEAGRAYLVTEAVAGRSLADAVKAGPLPRERARPIAVQIALVLAAAHARGIVHRDLQSHNIWLAHSGDQADVVKVLDFGLAHDPGEDGLTGSGMRLGETAYMAPEYIEDDTALGPAADLYSLGIVLFEMLTGSPPFVGARFDVLEHHVSTPAPAPSTRVAGIPGWLDDLVTQLLAKDPAERPADAREVANTLLIGG